MRRLLLLAFVVFLAVAPAWAALNTIQSVTIDNGGASGNYTAVAGVAGQTIQVYGVILFCNGANNVTFKSGTTNIPPTKWPVTNLTANQGFVLDLYPLTYPPWMTMRSTATATDNDVIINFSAAQQCSGILYYTQG